MNGKPVIDEELSGWHSFIYIITNIKTGKKYIGKKKLLFTRHKRVKGKVRRKKIVSKSDWETYYGSSKSLHIDIEKYGKENFKREIIKLCSRASEANYYEMREQVINDVLLKPDLYYNDYIGGRISRMQLGISSGP